VGAFQRRKPLSTNSPGLFWKFVHSVATRQTNGGPTTPTGGIHRQGTKWSPERPWLDSKSIPTRTGDGSASSVPNRPQHRHNITGGSLAKTRNPQDRPPGSPDGTKIAFTQTTRGLAEPSTGSETHTTCPMENRPAVQAGLVADVATLDLLGYDAKKLRAPSRGGQVCASAISCAGDRPPTNLAILPPTDIARGCSCSGSNGEGSNWPGAYCRSATRLMLLAAAGFLCLRQRLFENTTWLALPPRRIGSDISGRPIPSMSRQPRKRLLLPEAGDKGDFDDYDWVP